MLRRLHQPGELLVEFGMAEGVGLEMNRLGGALASPAGRCGKREFSLFPLPFAGTRQAETELLFSPPRHLQPRLRSCRAELAEEGETGFRQRRHLGNRVSPPIRFFQMDARRY